MKRLLSAALMLISVGAYAHSHLLEGTLSPRKDASGNIPAGLKGADDCGGLPRSAGTTTTFRPGQSLVVQWKETIQHKGYFGIYFSEKGDKEFTEIYRQTDKNDKQSDFEATIKLPNIKCDDCTIELIQHMDDGGTGNFTPYYSCANIKLDGEPATADDPPVNCSVK